MKTIYITVQIDAVTAVDLATIEEAIEKALKAYKQKQVTLSISETLGLPLPVQVSE